MPTYTYFCQSCQLRFEKFAYISDYRDQETCPECDTFKNVVRELGYDVYTIHRNVLTDKDSMTLQHRADYNTKRMSKDEKIDRYYEQNKYKYEGQDKDLPSGMTRINPKDKDSVMKKIEKKF